MDWDGRFFHAVAEAGSRRRRHGSSVCRSRPWGGASGRWKTGWMRASSTGSTANTLTGVGMRVFEKTGEMAEVARCIADRATGERQSIAGPVSLTAPEGLGTAWLPQRLSDLSDLHPDLEMHVSVSNRVVDVSRRGGDRGAHGHPHDQSLVGRRVGSVPLGCSRRPVTLTSTAARPVFTRSGVTG